LYMWFACQLAWNDPEVGSWPDEVRGALARVLVRCRQAEGLQSRKGGFSIGALDLVPEPHPDLTAKVHKQGMLVLITGAPKVNAMMA